MSAIDDANDERTIGGHWISERIERAIDAAGHVVFITNSRGRIEYVNPAFEKVTGYSAKDALGTNPRILKSGEMSASYYETLWETIKSGEVWSKPIVNRRKSGDLYHADETIAPITDDSGAIEGFIAIQTDISERVETREELKLFKRIVQRVEDPIMIQDTDGRFELANDAVCEYADMSLDELVGSDEFAFMNPTAAEEIAERKRHVIDTGRPVTYEVTSKFPDERERSFVTTRYPKHDETGEVDGTIAICRDVTEQLERERQLRVLVRILRHNINNKMSVILGNAGLLCDLLPDDEQDISEDILSAGEELVELAETKRRIVKLLTDPPDSDVSALNATVERIAAETRHKFPESTITVRYPSEFLVEAIPQLEDALEELIENAVIHAERPDPIVEIVAEQVDDEIRLTISDNGPGIPEIERNVLSPSTELSQTVHSRGLGLRFVDHVLKASNGSLNIAENDDGAIVELTLRPATNSDPAE